jgi:hypothetical protein
MTIHWKALEEHFLKVKLVFFLQNVFSEFSLKKPILKVLISPKTHIVSLSFNWRTYGKYYICQLFQEITLST